MLFAYQMVMVLMYIMSLLHFICSYITFFTAGFAISGAKKGCGEDTTSQTIQWTAKVFKHCDVFPLKPIVNELCNIKCCGKKMYQVFVKI